VAGATAREKSGVGGAAAIVTAMVAVWVRLPDVPVSVIAAMPALALVPAISVRFWAVPGASVRTDGLPATPEDNPLRETLTLPVNPFSAFAVTETDFPVLPAVRLRFAGATVREKSGVAAAAAIVKAIIAEWVRLPDFPVSVIVAVPALALVPALSVRFLPVPGVSVSIAGLAITPVGSPDKETLTLPVNPFSALAVIETDFPMLPAVRLRLAGATVSEKSGSGAAALTVSALDVVWVRPPDVPVSVIVAVPALAEAPAVRARFLAVPGASVRTDGLPVTPEGNPLRETLTLLVNPFSAFAVIETDFPVLPAIRLRLAGTTASEKSGSGAAALTVSAMVAV